MTATIADRLDLLIDRTFMSDRLGAAIATAHIVRRKGERRAIVRYETDNGPMLAKVRAGHRASSPYRLMQAFRTVGFEETSDVRVAEPVAAFDDLETWVQRVAPGQPGELAVAVDPIAVARAGADAAYRIHTAGVSTRRVHTIDDELRILCERFTQVRSQQPKLSGELDRVLDRGAAMAASLGARPSCAIHRDFYADQLLISSDHVTVIDFDLYCTGDPAVDIGNFIGHLSEQALRTMGDVHALDEARDACVDAFCSRAGDSHRPAIALYDVLTLARHVALSTTVSGRAHLTNDLLRHCARRLDRS
jgi:hypothetical protein